ncbi:hypothetical protein ASE85_21695 [Sphingobium sp. Leaf26]|uniref:hypothetical protein n=1 Tax=Sphingobium sp. Leaf26 TaxID=1735693 RepID=UPI0006F31C18|nr:hypothetical protein [Sphingobium sp. Leaf26]KQN01808.1 hypothetical protein ASE85_21695 [Sphingobium sp. Leaf26]
MIQISKIDDLSFTVRFDPQMAQELSDFAGQDTIENALACAITDAILLINHYPFLECDLDDDVPF